MDIQALLDQYEESHQSLACKASHAVGIPLIVLSLPLLLVNWRRALAFFLAGWVLQFVGHAVEGRQPKFLEGAEWLLVGVVWWLQLAATPLRALRSRS